MIRSGAREHMMGIREHVILTIAQIRPVACDVAEREEKVVQKEREQHLKEQLANSWGNLGLQGQRTTILMPIP